MQNTNTNSDASAKNYLAELVYTKDDLAKTSEEVDLLEKALYYTDPLIFEKTLKEEVGESFSLVLKALFAKNQDKKQILKDLKASLANFQTLDLKIAFEPSQATLEKITTWAKANLGELVVVNCEFDPQIIAGAEISFAGKYTDASLRKVLADVVI